MHRQLKPLDQPLHPSLPHACACPACSLPSFPAGGQLQMGFSRLRTLHGVEDGTDVFADGCVHYDLPPASLISQSWCCYWGRDQARPAAGGEQPFPPTLSSHHLESCRVGMEPPASAGTGVEAAAAAAAGHTCHWLAGRGQR